MMGKNKEAAASFRRALELKPQNVAVTYNLLGAALYRQDDKKLLEEAADSFNRAIELSKGEITKAYYNLGYALMKLERTSEGVAAFQSYLDKEPFAKEASQVKAIIRKPSLANEKFALPFSVRSHRGGELSLESVAGKIVLLDFWAVWCPPCRAEMPEVKKIKKKFAGQNFAIIGINLDTDLKKFESYLIKEGIDWPQYYDGEGWQNKIVRMYSVRSIPQTVLIDQDGVIRAVGLRGGALSKKIEELLKQLPER